MAVKVVVCGPNLRDQSKGDIVVHVEGCGDLVRYGRSEPEYANGTHMTANSKREVVEMAYPPSQFQYSEAEYQDYRSAVYFFPCCSRHLPEEFTSRIRAVDVPPRARTESSRPVPSADGNLDDEIDDEVMAVSSYDEIAMD